MLTRSGLVFQANCPRARRVGRGWPRSPPTVQDRSATDCAVPRYQWASEFLGAFTVQLAKPPESFGPAPDGLHITFYIASGEIHGPKINAKIRGEGGDWMLVRRDGVGVADVRITYETDDGALLLSRYYGIFDLGPGGYERALRNEYDPVPPLVLAPQFVTSHPNWLWLNRLQCLAVGRVTMADLLVRFDLYAIRAGQPLPSSGLPRAHDADADWRCPLVRAGQLKRPSMVSLNTELKMTRRQPAGAMDRRAMGRGQAGNPGGSEPRPRGGDLPAARRAAPAEHRLRESRQNDLGIRAMRNKR